MQGKSVLKTQEKFYLADATLKYCMMGFNPKSVGAMLEIKDHYSKYVVTLDEPAAGNINGVKIVHLADFLLSSEY